MNAADSAEMMLNLSARGCVQTQELSLADIALVNTCTVRDHAEHKALSFLGRLAKWKAEKTGRIIIFAGCAAERLGAGVRRKFPQIDIIAGAKNIENFTNIIEKSRLFDNSGATRGTDRHTDKSSDAVALVNIMRGCSCKCSYCIVPYVRGEAYSIPPEDIFKRIEDKLSAGAKEIVLLGQTVNEYNYKGKNFSKLLQDIVKLPSLARVRYISPHPIFINDEFIQTLSSSQKISKHIHLPLQSGSTKVLTDMKRGYTREDFLQKAKMLSSVGIEISTDIIVGYPTETEPDFKDTLTLLDKINFTAAYCFKFSPRAGTPAALLTPLDEKILENRLDILLNKIKQSSALAYARQLGTMQSVLMETASNGRTLTNFWVRTTRNYNKGETIELKIKDVKDTILIA
jgi:tRNA-2-methylthio-N6-dimethylallyladenosine synthase